VGLVIALVAAQVGVQLAGGPLWLVAVLALMTMLGLALCALVVVIPLARETYT
jgi:hypothetical protein